MGTTETGFSGILMPNEEEKFGKLLDEIVDFRKVFSNKAWLGAALEVVDGKIFIAAIRNLDDRLIDKLPPDYKPDSRALVLAALDKKWDQVVEIAPRLLNKPINIPGIGEDVELAILAGLVQAIYLAVQAHAKKNLD
jgi:hypothetical protein